MEKEINEKILFIMGNGPSLGEIMNNKEYLNILRNNHTFGLNSAYRAYEKYNFYPTYFGCFDCVVNESHKESFENLVQENNPIKEFYFIGNSKKRQKIFKNEVFNNKKFIKFHMKFAPKGISICDNIPNTVDTFDDIGSSGANSAFIGIIKGYKNIILLGCDCNYVEKVDGVIHYDQKAYHRLELSKDLDVNPNYWFNNYQQKGDRFNLPGNDDIQMKSWEKLYEMSKLSNCKILNLSTISKIPFFPKINFKHYHTNYNNIFMICSCKKYDYRIKLLNELYKNNIKSNDLFVFLVGDIDIENNYINGNTLFLKCGDLYEDLPCKVIFGIQFITEFFNFKKLIKVDDDVVINFDKYYELLNILPNNKLYYGRKNPPDGNVIPSNKWHIGKLDKNHEYNNKVLPDSYFPFNRETPIQWCSGGIYILSNDVCKLIMNLNNDEINMTKNHLYEDLNLYNILYKRNINPVFDKRGNNIYFSVRLPSFLEKNLTKLQNIPIENYLKNVENINSFHIGSLSPIYDIDENKFTKIFNILNTVNNK